MVAMCLCQSVVCDFQFVTSWQRESQGKCKIVHDPSWRLCVCVTAARARVRNCRESANKVFVKTARTHARAEIRGPLHEVVVPRGPGRGFEQQLTPDRRVSCRLRVRRKRNF